MNQLHSKQLTQLVDHAGQLDGVALVDPDVGLRLGDELGDGVDDALMVVLVLVVVVRRVAVVVVRGVVLVRAVVLAVVGVACKEGEESDGDM